MRPVEVRLVEFDAKSRRGKDALKKTVEYFVDSCPNRRDEMVLM